MRGLRRSPLRRAEVGALPGRAIELRACCLTAAIGERPLFKRTPSAGSSTRCCAWRVAAFRRSVRVRPFRLRHFLAFLAGNVERLVRWGRVGRAQRGVGCGKRSLSRRRDGVRIRHETVVRATQRPSPHVHGFLLCSRAVFAHLPLRVRLKAPYPWLSVPVVLGTGGGSGRRRGFGLARCPRRDTELGDARRTAGFGFLVLLAAPRVVAALFMRETLAMVHAGSTSAW